MSPRAALPIVAIVGRPNVGKSRLFNRYAGHSRALVRNEPGITRDRIVEELEVSGRRILVVDTAGLDSAVADDLASQVQAQARSAVEQADAILFVVDGQAGLLPDDEEIARTLRRTFKPIALAVNKIDIPEHRVRVDEFHRLGFERILAVSAEHGAGAFDLIESLVEALPAAPPLENETAAAVHTFHGSARVDEVPDYSEVFLDDDFGRSEEENQPELEEEEAPGGEISVAVVGRPNVGKSSLLNRLFGEERLVVSNVPGTTRDAIDVELEVDGVRFRFVDTAGLRRPGRRDQSIERASALMTLRSLERADVALLLIDAEEGFSDQDAHVAQLTRERGCAAVVLANKWDRVEGEAGKNILEGIRHGLRFMDDVPILSVSARTGARLPRIYPALHKVIAAARRRVQTADLNRWLQETVRRHEPALARRSGHARRPIRFFYAVQTGSSPPTFVLFCTRPEAIQVSYRRYLENRLRERFDFEGTPIRLRFRPRSRKK